MKFFSKKEDDSSMSSGYDGSNETMGTTRIELTQDSVSHGTTSAAQSYTQKDVATSMQYTRPHC